MFSVLCAKHARLPCNRLRISCFPSIASTRQIRVRHTPKLKAALQLRDEPKDIDIQRLRAAANRALRHASFHLQSGRRESGLHIIGRTLFRKEFLPVRSMIMEKTVMILLRNRAFMELFTTFEQVLAQGAIPSSKIVAILDAFHAVALKDTQENQTLERLKLSFQDPAFGDTTFEALLGFVEDSTSHSPSFVDLMVTSYLRSRTPNYKLSPGIQTFLAAQTVKSGQFHALDTILDVPTNGPPSTRAGPYPALIQAVAEYSPEDPQYYSRIILRMTKHDIPADIAVFNAIMSALIRQREYGKAFSLYHYLAGCDIRKLMPDNITFTTLWACLDTLDRNHTAKRPDNMLAPRQLFCDMTACHTSFRSLALPTSLGAVTQRGMEMALRVFINRHDYAGAYVVLRTFEIFKFPITDRIQHLVIHQMLRRIRGELYNHHQPTQQWTGQFLSVTQEELRIMLVDDRAFNAKAVSRMLDLGEEVSLSDEVSLTSEPRPEAALRYFLAPIKSSIYKLPPASVKYQKVDPMPIHRLLSRALLATIRTQNPNLGEQALESAVMTAKDAMKPSKHAVAVIRSLERHG